MPASADTNRVDPTVDAAPARLKGWLPRYWTAIAAVLGVVALVLAVAVFREATRGTEPVPVALGSGAARTGQSPETAAPAEAVAPSEQRTRRRGPDVGGGRFVAGGVALGRTTREEIEREHAQPPMAPLERRLIVAGGDRQDRRDTEAKRQRTPPRRPLVRLPDGIRGPEPREKPGPVPALDIKI